MSSGRFAALENGDDSDSDDMSEKVMSQQINIPAYEDLSTERSNEEMVLDAIYGSDFSRQNGAWGCPKLEVQIKPPDLDSDKIGSQLTLSVQLGKKYPYVIPTIDLKQVKGLSKKSQKALLQRLHARGTELAQNGSVMICEFVQIVEDFLIDNNIDPTISAWDQMKAREAKEKKEKEKFSVETSLLESSSNPNWEAQSPPTLRTSLTNPNLQPTTASVDVERELARQREAIEAANRERKKQGNPFHPNAQIEEEVEQAFAFAFDDEDEFSDGLDDDENDGPSALTGTSRYKTDFIELGVLGRGGGGEVVKVRNRLDRRIYAIKKIVLESERGKFAKFGEIQNQKLRREVKTISRMTHKNIVRYYQAWVEGGESDPILSEENENEIQEGSKEKLQQGESTSEGNSNNLGWWSNSNQDEPEDNASTGSSASWSDEHVPQSDADENFQLSRNLHSGSMVDLLEHENDLGFQNPLLSGLGFENASYHGFYQRKNSSKSTKPSLEDDSKWDDSSVKVDHSKSNQSILYIQVRFV